MCLTKVIFLIILINFYSIESKSQNKNNYLVSLGFAYRQNQITIEDLGSSRLNRYGFSYEAVLNTPAITLDFGKKIRLSKANFELTISNYFRNTPWYGGYPPYKGLKRSFIHDHFINLLYPFKMGKSKLNYKVGTGLGVMNVGTNFTYDKITGNVDINGNPIIEKNVKGNFAFFAGSIILGVQKKRIDADIITHISKRDYLFDKLLSLWIEAKIKYSFKL